MNKQEYIGTLWAKKSPAEVVLVMYQLIDNSDVDESAKKKTYAVLKGIITYLDRGDDLMEHHRKYLYDVWNDAWNAQVDNTIKEEIKEWLLEPPF
jgi:hypothetical protein